MAKKKKRDIFSDRACAKHVGGGMSVKDFQRHSDCIFEQSIGSLGEKIENTKILRKMEKRYKHDKAAVIDDFLTWAHRNGYILVSGGTHGDGKHGDDLALIQKSLDRRKRSLKKLDCEEVGTPAEIKFLENKDRLKKRRRK